MYTKPIITAIFFLLISSINLNAETSSTFTINKSAITIIKQVRSKVGEKEFSIPPEAARLLNLADLSFDFYYRTSSHYAKLEINLENNIRRVNGFHKTLEIWNSEQDGKALIKSSVDIDFGKQHRFPLRWVDCLKEKLIKHIEQQILDFEQQKMLELAQ
jgi:hypothetical protein